MLSKYAEKLLGDGRKRYLEKLASINGVDPYALGSGGLNTDTLPTIEMPDLFNYLVLGTSAYTSDQFKAFRSLEAYNQCYNGWIKELGGCVIDGKNVVVGQVRHSQTFAATQAHCWIISEQNGTILSAHCTCKAGLGETCTHVAAMLFYIEAYTRIKGPTSCTQTECKWMLPKHVTKLSYRPLADMDFSSAKKQKKTFDSRLSAGCSSTTTFSTSSAKKQKTFDNRSSVGSSAATPFSTYNLSASTSSSATSSKLSVAAAPTTLEIDDFYFKLSTCGHKPALLSVVSPYSDSYVTDMSVNVQPLACLFKKGHITFTLAELQTMAEAVDVTMSENDIQLIEMKTRGQAKNKNWYLYRAGRITASRLKDVCRTDTSNPSLSLIKTICYPFESAFKSAATEWGINNEQAALTKYKQSYNHNDVSVEQCGFIINSDYPFMGASPDALVSCQCCGKGVVEIKCPYSFRYNDVMDYVFSSDSCYTAGHDIQLKREHRYYYQVQAQMHICDVEFCDFVVCTFPLGVPCIFVNRVNRDSQFWDEHRQEASQFFRLCVLPELLGKAYTRTTSL